MRRARTQTLTVNDSVDINHNVVTESDNQINLENENISNIADTSIALSNEINYNTETINIIPITETETKIEETKMEQPTRNILEIVLNDSPIDVVNLTTGYTNFVVPKVSGKVKLSNLNLYRINIKDTSLNADNFYMIKHYSKYSDYFRIVSVANGKASIVPIISGLELKSGDVIGELI